MGASKVAFAGAGPGSGTIAGFAMNDELVKRGGA